MAGIMGFIPVFKYQQESILSKHNEKKITFLISSLAGGGAEGVCVNVANGLAEKGWQVDLVVLNLNNASYLDRVSAKINLIDLNVKNARYSFGPLQRYLRKNKVRKVLVFVNELAVLLVLIRKVFFLDFKVIARNINTFSQKVLYAKGTWRKRVVLPMLRKFYSDVDHVINQCRAMEEDLLSFYPNLEGRTTVIYNPVNKITEDAAREIDFSQVEKQNYLLCVGRLEEQKAFHFAIRAFARLVAAHPDLRLKIIGQGRLEPQLKEEANRLGVFDNIDFEGFQKNTIPYYLNAKATLLTSLYEGFPNVLIESLILGTPVVAFDCKSGPAEIVDEGINGHLVNYLDVEHLHSTLNEFLSKGIRFNPEDYLEKYGLAQAIAQYEGIIND